MSITDVPNSRADHANPKSLTALIADATRVLTRAGVPTPEVDALLLAGHVLGVSRGELHAKALSGVAARADEAHAIAELIERRAAREPLQHITGVAHFRFLELLVGPGVFVPRPETESVAQLAIDALVATASSEPIGVDLGTGSGAIALALATEVPHSRVYGVEVSPLAFVWTKQNFRKVGAKNARAVFIDLADALHELDGTVDVVVSNPPYIPIGAIPRDPEVRMHDPEIALYGGTDGLDVVRTVSATARRLLHAGGSLVIEHGELQAQAISDLLASDGWVAIATSQDLLGRDRATSAIKA
jgi:release factor glutamine methyltransferase